MVRTYPIHYIDKCVGTAEVIQEGLFYKIYCQCQPWCNKRCRICVRTFEKNEDLGICVSNGGNLTLTKRIPIKQIGNKLAFSAVVDNNEEQTFFVQLERDLPFTYFERIDSAKLAVLDGVVGVVF